MAMCVGMSIMPTEIASCALSFRVCGARHGLGLLLERAPSLLLLEGPGGICSLAPFSFVGIRMPKPLRGPVWR